MQPSTPLSDGKTARAARKEHAGKLFIAELQFRLASAVRLATTGGLQPLDLPTLWTHGKHSVSYHEIALRQDQADFAACFLHRSATYILAVAVKDAVKAVVGDAKSITDPSALAAYQIARLIRNAFAHDPFSPKWAIDPNCRDTVFAVPDIITLDTHGIDGAKFDWRHYGGPLALLHLCRFVRSAICGDKLERRRKVPRPRQIIYQQGGAILKRIGDLKTAKRTTAEGRKKKAKRTP